MAHGTVLRFGPFELDTESGELTRRGRAVDLQPQPARVLVELVQRSGELVTRQELADLLWDPGTHVDRQQGLNYCIRRIRRALGDSSRSARYVETLPRRGYRFVATTERVSRATPPRHDDDPGDGGTETRNGAGSRRLLIAAFALTVLAVVSLAVWSLAVRTGDASGPATPEPPPVGAAAHRPMLAVLPLRDLGASGDDPFFAAALGDEITSSLSHLDPQRLGVIARTSSQRFSGTSAGVQEIGRALGADYLLEGSVRRSGDEVRIAVRLIRVEDQTLLWSGTYEERMVDTFDLQRRVAREVAAALSLQLPVMADAADTPDPAAWEAYLQGVYLLDHPVEGRDPERYLLRAVELDPDFSRGWRALAQVYFNRRPFDPADVERARRAARRSLDIAPSSGGHLVLGLVAFYSDHDYDAAERHLLRAVELNPSHARARHHYGALLAVQGHHREALEAVRQALQLDPLSLAVGADLGWFNLFGRHYGAAEDHFRAALEVASGRASYWIRRGLLGTLVRARRWEEAAELVRTWPASDAPGAAVEAIPGDPEAMVRDFLRREIVELRRLHEERVLPASTLAIDYALLGEADAALTWLERAEREGYGWQVPFLRVDPRLDGLRSEPRFTALVNRLGLPDPAAAGASERPPERPRTGERSVGDQSRSPPDRRRTVASPA